MWFEFASGQIQGKRTAQEDALEIGQTDPAGEVPPGCARRLRVALADGMGGHVGGRIASSIVSRKFLEELTVSADWETRAVAAFSAANDALRGAVDKRRELDGMGSTLVGLEVGAGGLCWISIGDTGLYLLSGDTFSRLNEDHSFGAYLDDQARKGLISEEVARGDRRRNQLFHALLGEPIDHFEHRATPVVIRPGDIVVAATDGLNTLDDATIARLLKGEPQAPASVHVDRLLAAVEAADRPRQDNATLVVICARDGDMPDAPSISRIVSPFMIGRAPAGAADPSATDEPITDVISRPTARAAEPVPAPGGTARPALLRPVALLLAVAALAGGALYWLL